ncbi:DUF2341 domain-containing protein [Paraliomyxa miuraensis]|uniref:DUF2341 domain-containing protein n=1 Tax=Paraliomyxa miuraensis TaxID=376150 RepID=UPI00224DC7DF|nr:DUF2341 domain-containing protein [Paraliomyxa miuraensis]MCX4244673.1 DUF2341 domain-containing protein [Paraliomyxa miuraensis]
MSLRCVSSSFRLLSYAVGLMATVASCQLDSDSKGTLPMGVSGSGETGSTDDGTDDPDSTGAPSIEGPRKRRLDIAPAFAGGVGVGTLLVVLDGTRIEYEDTQPDGSDLRFFGPEEAGAYPIEIEHWDPGGTSFVWVRIDSIALPDHLWMYYGDTPGFASLDPSAVWDGAFAAVWHMERGGSPTMPDTTAAGHDLQFIGFGGDLDVPGPIGLSVAMVPDDMATAGPLELFDPGELALTDAFTLEAWVSTPVAADDSTHSVLRKTGSFELQTLEATSTRPKVVVRPEGVAGAQVAELGSSLALDSWTYLAATYRADTGVLSIFRNGALEGSITVGGDAVARMLDVTDAALQVGHGLHGGLDEVRVSTIARAPEWIAVQHASMSDQLLTFGAPQPR